jgi:predicted Zn-dependent protease
VLFCALLAQALSPQFHFMGAGTAHALTVGEEQEIGEKLLSIVRHNFNLIDEPDLIQYVTDLGKDILQVVDSHFYDYKFFIVDKNEFNAFAAPAGLIFVYTGLIEAMDTEDELISVMAHETGHVTHRHIAQQGEKSKAITIATLALVLAGIASGSGDVASALITGGMAAGQTAQLKYSREDEEEADRAGYDYMRTMRRNPVAMVGMLQKMHREHMLNASMIPPYLLTHPDPGLRMGYIQDLLENEPKNTFPPADPFPFQRLKYRLLSITKNPAKLIVQLQSPSRPVAGEERPDPMRLFGLSQAYLASAQFDKAQATLQKVMAAMPDRTILRTDMGRILFEAGQYEKALILFRQARDLRPDCAYTAFYLAKTLQQQGKFPEALVLHEEILQKLPTLSHLHYQIGQIMANQGDKAAGHYHLGLYYWFEDDVESARFHLKETVRLSADNADLNGKAADMLDKIKKLEKM